MRRVKFFSVLLCAVLILTCCCGCSISSSNEETGYQSDLKDGEYTVYSKYYDPFGYGLMYTMKVRDGIVTSVNLKETNSSGTDRLTDNTAVNKWEGCNQNLSQVLANFYDSVIHRQSAQVDAVTGATVTSDSFNTLSKAAFSMAKSGTSSQVLDDFTWTYSVTNSVDSASGSQETLKVTYDGSDMTNVECGEVVNSTALYATGKIYSGFAGQTMTSKTLDPITSADNPAEAERYNGMLAQINQLRQPYK
ncbi:MAG: FMN-binding protein [Bacilli bacterium]|jgi:major membrane immunogen (membrane-anchored lipoprotein)